MAQVGGVVEDFVVVSSGDFLTIQPDGDNQWIIMNIYHEGPAELYRSNGTINIKIDEDSAPGAWVNFKFFVVEDNFLRVKNTDENSMHIGYDGVRTR